jgi:hypothetical protein
MLNEELKVYTVKLFRRFQKEVGFEGSPLLQGCSRGDRRLRRFKQRLLRKRHRHMAQRRR